MVPNLLQVLSVKGECVLVVRVNGAQKIPQSVDSLCLDVYLFAELIEHVQIGHKRGKMCPELHLQIRYLLNRLLHLKEQPLKLNHISELWVDLFVVDMILYYEVFYDVLKPENRELLLEGGFLLLGEVKFKEACMNVVHGLE
jgi:hypothetical protein